MGQTGETIPYTPEEPEPAVRERHLSVRVDRDMAIALQAMAVERGLTLSHLFRELLTEAVNEQRSTASLDARALVNRLAADGAEVRRRLAG